MRIIKLPDKEEGWAYLTVDNRPVGMFWIEADSITVKIKEDHWLIVLPDEEDFLGEGGFIFVDAIVKK